MGDNNKSMKFLLTIVMCSSVANTCMPPHSFKDLYPTSYECMVDGYQKSLDKTIEIGKAEINKHGIYMKFDCRGVVPEEETT